MSARASIALASIVAAIGGCTVDALVGGAYAGPKNDCAAGCGDGACVGGACQSATTTFSYAIEVTPPANAHYAGDFTFGYGVYNDGGAHPITLPALARVTLRIDATNIPEVTKPIRLSVRLESTDAWSRGTDSGKFEFRSDAATTALSPPGWGSISFTVPPGQYSVYVAPLDADVVAVLPPLRYIDQSNPNAPVVFASGGQERVLTVGRLSTLDVHIDDVDPSLGALTEKIDGVDVSVVDRTTGNLVSTIDTTCLHPASAHLRLSPGLTQHTYSVRFAPRACDVTTLTRPTYEFDLDALNIEGKGVGTVALPSSTSIANAGAKGPQKRSFSAKVCAATSSPGACVPLGAKLELHSRKINLPDTWKTGNAIYTTETESIGTGSNIGQVFPVDVVVGTYDVQVVPSLDYPFNAYGATTVTNVDLVKGDSAPRLYANPRRSVCAGRFQIDGHGGVTCVNESGGVSGGVVAPGDAPFGIGNVDFIPEGVLSPALESLVPVARAQTLPINGATFTAALDPGVYDIVARIPESSGYPWVLLQQVVVRSQTVDLHDSLRAVVPAPVSGRILDPNGDPVAHATVRARAQIVSDADKATVIAAPVVAETKTNDVGDYVLLVPSTIAKVATTTTTK